MGSRHRLSIGVDFGTTFSGSLTIVGFAFFTSQDLNIRDAEIVTSWPGNSAGYLEKVPSQIAYKIENEKLKENTWGYAIPRGAKRHCWAKLLLDGNARITQFDDPKLGGAGWPALPLPKGKVAGDVVADYLTFLYEYCMEYLSKRITDQVLRITPIDFWFTCPAIWLVLFL
ncbi:MAG: hypothetical protein MMC33_002202 [Icmadophila ericetorum]|nr:hypothetical protein [Icmadophila ericetorum]